MTTYLLDSDVLISAKRHHYRMAVCPAFWDWILHAHAAGRVFSVKTVQMELKDTGDALSDWAKQNSAFFLPADDKVTGSLAEVSLWTTSQDYKSHAIAEFFNAADYWLVGHAHAHGFTVVTHEVPDPKSRKRVKIPDVCAGLGVSCTNPFEMLEKEGAVFIL